MMLRLMDMTISLLGLIFICPIIIVLIIFGFMDTGSPFFVQERLGRYQKPFNLWKLRTMQVGTKSVPTHLACPTKVTRYGAFLRQTKLDELPQLWNVLIGDMSFVGPRPSLISQQELTIERARRGIFNVRPGITGLSQICGIDMSTPAELAAMDAKMIENLDLKNYVTYLLKTLAGAGRGDRIRSSK